MLQGVRGDRCFWWQPGLIRVVEWRFEGQGVRHPECGRRCQLLWSCGGSEWERQAEVLSHQHDEISILLGEQNSMEGWTQQEFLAGSMEALWPAFLMRTFNGKLMWLSICKLEASGIPFIFYKLSKYWLWAPLPLGRQEVWPHSFWVFLSSGFMPGFLILRLFCHLMLSPYCPSQLVPLRSAVWSHLSHTWVRGSWKGLKS